VSEKISGSFPYTNPNLEARKLLDKAERENPASYPPGNPKLVHLPRHRSDRRRRRQADHGLKAKSS
jgi:hypothetical protein